MPLVDLEEEIIDKDFRQSCWLALQFWVQPSRIFTVGVPQACHGIILSDFFTEGSLVINKKLMKNCCKLVSLLSIGMSHRM